MDMPYFFHDGMDMDMAIGFDGFGEVFDSFFSFEMGIDEKCIFLHPVAVKDMEFRFMDEMDEIIRFSLIGMHDEKAVGNVIKDGTVQVHRIPFHDSQFLEPFQTILGGLAGHEDFFPQLRHGNAAVLFQFVDDFPVCFIQHFGTHGAPPVFLYYNIGYMIKETQISYVLNFKIWVKTTADGIFKRKNVNLL